MTYLGNNEVEKRLEMGTLKIERNKMYDSSRPVGAKEIPNETRAIIGTLALIEGPAVAAELLNVSPAQASNYSKGMVTHGVVDEDLKKTVDERVGKIHNVALEKLMESIEGMDLSSTKGPKERSEIAKNLATVIEKTTPKSDNMDRIVRVEIGYPKEKSIDSYETIEIPALPVS